MNCSMTNFSKTKSAVRLATVLQRIDRGITALKTSTLEAVLHIHCINTQTSRQNNRKIWLQHTKKTTTIHTDYNHLKRHVMATFDNTDNLGKSGESCLVQRERF